MATTVQQDTNQPDYQCAAAREMVGDICYVRDTEKGTRHLRSRRTEYLPREEAETDKAYEIRLSRAVMVNFFCRALNALVGLVFKESPKLSEDVPDVMAGREATDTQSTIEGQLEDCDLAGTHWTVFIKELFKDAMRDGHSFLLTEMPPPLAEGATRADEIAANRRPYWVKYTADQAVNWRIDSRGRLQQVTLMECSLEPDGEYGEQMVYRYRVLRPGSWELYRKVKDDNGAETLVTEDSGFTSLTEIPLSVCYGRYCAPMQSKPPLLDLAVVNIAHFNELSDYRIYLHICSRPILFAAGRDTTKNAPQLSAYSLVDVKDGGNVGYAETSGSALGAARQDLKDMEEHMGVLGLQMVTEQTSGDKTATEERGDQIKELSELATAAQSLHDCIERALGFWAEYLGLDSGGSVELAVKPEQMIGEQAARVFLDAAGSVFTKATVRKILASAFAPLMPADYSEEAESAELEAEAQKARDAMPDVGQQIGRMFNAGAVE